uniref:L antigen family member 3 n=1 Tax=Romanomermis culicivorax TaxID=13658 RepID=A0A915IZA2_ROMCU
MDSDVESQGDMNGVDIAADLTMLHKANLEIPFENARRAKIAYNSLRIDKEPKRGMVTKCLELTDSKLKVSFAAQDLKNLRTSMQAFFALLMLVEKTMVMYDTVE